MRKSKAEDLEHKGLGAQGRAAHGEPEKILEQAD